MDVVVGLGEGGGVGEGGVSIVCNYEIKVWIWYVCKFWIINLDL